MREVARLDDRGDAVAVQRVLDPRAPGRVGQRRAAGPDVAAGVDRVVGDAVALEQLAAAVDRPALDEPRRVDLRASDS